MCTPPPAQALPPSAVCAKSNVVTSEWRTCASEKNHPEIKGRTGIFGAPPPFYDYATANRIAVSPQVSTTLSCCCDYAFCAYQNRPMQERSETAQPARGAARLPDRAVPADESAMNSSKDERKALWPRGAVVRERPEVSASRCAGRSSACSLCGFWSTFADRRLRRLAVCSNCWMRGPTSK